MAFRIEISDDGHTVSYDDDTPVLVNRDLTVVRSTRAQLIAEALKPAIRELVRLNDDELRARAMAAEQTALQSRRGRGRE
jgi:hypothetical protein